MQHFIAEFKNALDSQYCEYLIEKFEKEPVKQQGRIGSGVDKQKKNSVDIYLSDLPTWKTERDNINNLIYQGLTQYVKAYPHLITGAISPSIKNPKTGEIQTITADLVGQLPESKITDIIKSVFTLDDINMQKYLAGEGNFNHWHSEHYPHPTDPQQKSLHRTLLWLIYLNDVPEGGETDFLYQQASIKPSAGSIVLSPCSFTHTHRGRTPISNDKYVLASWVMYQPAANIYT